MKPTTIIAISVSYIALAGCMASGKAPSTLDSTRAGYAPTPEGGAAGGGSSTSAEYSGPHSAPSKASRGYGGTGGTGGYVPPPAPSQPGSTPGSVYHQPTTTPRRLVISRPVERPGLGTVFGRAVSSHVSFTSFTRSAAQPAGVVSINYNDYQGLWAMTRHLQRRCCGAISPYSVRAGVTVQLVDSFKSPLRGVQIGGRTIVMGMAGQRYGIMVHNQSGQRFEIVASVDGLDVIDGKPANLVKRGYILPPYGNVHIRGFRTSQHTVAAFRFGSVRNSYAARTGSARNVGVVGVAAFTEYRPVYSDSEVLRRLRARPFGNGYAQPPSN